MNSFNSFFRGPSATPASPASAVSQPPAHILASFQVPTANPVQLDAEWSYGWRCDRAVLSQAGDQARAAWIAKTMSRIRPAGVGVSRPIVSSDGRHSVSGWRARTFLSGSSAPRFDEMAAAALRFNEALKGEDKPSFMVPPEAGAAWTDADIFNAADAAAFAVDPTQWVMPVLDQSSIPREDVAEALAKAAQVAQLRTELSAEDQLVHADVIGCTIFDGSTDPMFTDFIPAWHPAGWSVALLIVDAMAWANGSDALLDRWKHIPDFEQLTVRAVLYRLLLHAMLPASHPEAWQGLSRVAEVIMARETLR